MMQTAWWVAPGDVPRVWHLGLSKCHCQFFWGVISRDQRSYQAFSRNWFWICNYLIRFWLFVTLWATNKRNFRQIPKKWWFNKKPSLLQQIPEQQWEWYICHYIYQFYHKESIIPGWAGTGVPLILWDMVMFWSFMFIHQISQREDMGNLGIVPELCIPPRTYYICFVQGKMEEIFWKQPTRVLS